MSTGQLTRSRSNRIIAGVCGGIAEATGMDIGLVRVITALIVLFTNVAGLLAYALAWIMIPEEGSPTSGLDQIMSNLRNNRGSDPNPRDQR